jgi:acetolactate synthase-1/2/3 large subunit
MMLGLPESLKRELNVERSDRSVEVLPNQRYDRMFELMDCHGEHVERPEEFRPAFERALRAGKTALVNLSSAIAR